MPANRRRSAITAPYERWVLLGKLLETRRRVLGHTWRTTFESLSGVNKRLQADIEKAAPDRVDHFMPGSFQLIAEGYRVTGESMLAVLRGEADELTPASPVPAPAPAGAASPFDPARSAQDRPWFDEINERRVALAARGITEPSGRQMFGEGTDDARAWDSIAAYGIPVGDVVWAVADLRRRAAARAGDSGAGAAGA